MRAFYDLIILIYFVFYPLTADQVCFRNKYRNEDICNARKLSKQVLVIPLYENIKIENIKFIVDILKG